MISGVVLLVAALLAVGGAAVGSVWATGLGGVAVLAGLAVMIRPAVPRPARLLLRGGLALLAVAVLVRVRGWTASPYDGGDLFAFVLDADRERDRFLRESAQAAVLILACVCLAAALLRVPRGRWRRSGGAAGLILLAGAAWSAIGVARDARPVTRPGNAFLEPGVRMAVAVGSRPDIDIRAAVTVAVPLLGAVLIVVALAMPSRPAEEWTASAE